MNNEIDEALRFFTERSLVMEGMTDRAMAKKMVDNWLKQVRSEAWEEGHEAAAMRVPEGVWHDTASPRPANPYRKEQGA